MKIVLDPITKRFTTIDPKREQKRLGEQRGLERQKRSAEMVDMKERGYTLQEIGDVCGITREAVRQKIDSYCDKVGFIKPVKRGSIQERLGLLPTSEAAKRVGCTGYRLNYYRKQGIINPKRVDK